MPVIKNTAILDSRPFASGIDRMAGQVRGFDKQLKMIKGSLAGAFAAGLVVRFIDNTLKAADEIDNMAKQSGLGVEALQALRTAGKEAGVEFETMRPPINALRRAMDSAKAGGEQQAEAFKKMGISMSELKRLNTEQTLARVGKAMSDANGDAEVLKASTVVLGAESTRLQEVFKQLGDDGIEGLIQKYKDLGMIMDENMIRVLDMQEESASRLTARLKMLGAEFVGTFALGIEGIGGFAGRMAEGQTAAEAYRDTIADLTSQINDLNEASAAAEEPSYLPTKEQIDYIQFVGDRLEDQMPALEKLAMLQDRLAGQRMAESKVPNDDYEERLRYAKLIAKTEDEIKKLKKDQADLAQDLIKKGMEFVNQGKGFISSVIEPFTAESEKPEREYSQLRRIGANMGAGGAMSKSESRQEKLIRQNAEFLTQQKKAVELLQAIKEQRGAVL